MRSTTLPRTSRMKTQAMSCKLNRQYTIETLCVTALVGGLVTHITGSFLWIVPMYICSLMYDAVLRVCSHKFNGEPVEKNAALREDSRAEESFSETNCSCCSGSHRSELEEHECHVKTALLCDLVPEYVVAELIKVYGPLNSTWLSEPYGEPQNSVHTLDYCSG